MNNTIKYIICLFLLSSVAIAEEPSGYSIWVEGDKSDKGVSAAYATAIDKHGDIIVGGEYTGVIQIGDSTFTSDSTSIFIAKYDTTGRVKWALRAYSNDDLLLNDICLDSNDNIYACGSFTGITFFGKKRTKIPANEDLFVVGINPDGEYTHLIQAGGIGLESAKSIAADPDNNLFVCGNHTELSQFGENVIYSFNDIDGFVARISTQGEWNWEWAESLGGQYKDQANAICCDSKGNAYLTGFINTYGRSNFIIGDSSYYLPAKETESLQSTFIYSLDKSGKFNLIRIAPSDFAIGWDIAYHKNEVSVVGVFKDAIIIPESGQKSGVSYDGFLWKLSDDGKFRFFTNTIGVGYESVTSIAINSKGDSFIGGFFNGHFAEMTPENEVDMFLLKIDSLGEYKWIKRAGGSGLVDATKVEAALSISLFEEYNYTSIYSAGPVFGDAVFDQTHSLYSNNPDKYGFFLWKVNETPSYLTLKTVDIQGYQSDELNIMITSAYHSELASCGVDTLFADLSYNYSLLFPLDGNPGEVKHNIRTLPIKIPIQNDFFDTLKIPVIAGLGNDSTTTLRLRNIRYNKGFLPIGQTIAGRFRLLDICYDGSDPRLIEPLGSTTFPNPAFSTITVSYSSAAPMDISYSLLDINGRDVLNKIDYQTSGNEHILSLNPKPIKGTYFLIIESDETTTSHRIEIAE
jgi:hypothetical protein